MKLVWASPYNHGSAIARFSHMVVTELRARGHEVAIYRTETGECADRAPIADPLILDPGSDLCEDWLQSADLVFANVGDHYGFHGRLFELFERRETIGILHDWCVLNLFLGWLHCKNETSRALEFIDRFYGERACEIFRNSSATDILRNAAVHFPMTEWCAGNLLGAVIHSEFYRERVESSCAGPVRKLSLAYPRPEFGRARRPGAEMLALRTFGIANPNKCIDRAIEAIAGDVTLRERVEYRVLGFVSDQERNRLEALASALGYEHLVLEGVVSHERLNEGLGEADVICCLRNPVLEGASASAIEGMQSGAPVIVSNDGFYAELPDELVLKVRPGEEVSDVRRFLRRLLSDPSERRQIGTSAAAWAEDEFSAARYCERLESAFHAYLAAEPYVSVSKALGRELGKIGICRNDPAIVRVADLLDRAFSLSD